MADVEAFESSDEAAAAIQALLDGGSDQGAPAAGGDDGDEAIVNEIQQKLDAPADGAEQNTSEEAPEGDTPADQPEEGEVPEAKKAEPEPAKPAPKVEPPANPQQPQTPNLSQIGQAITALQIQIAAEFPDIQTHADLLRLASSQNPEDQARLARFNIQREVLTNAQQQLSAASAAARTSWLASEQEKLNKAIPDIADPVKGPVLRTRLVEYAREQGYTPEQINSAASADIVILHDAMMYRDSLRHKAAEEAKAAKAIEAAKEKAKDAPKVQKPGVAQASTSKAEEKDKELWSRFEKSGHHDDLTAVLVHRGLV